MNVSRPLMGGLLVAAVVVIIGVMAAAAYATTGSSNRATTAAAKIKLPPNIAKKGRIDIALTTDYPPYEYLDASGKPVGIDIDLVNAIAKVLGVKLNFQRVAFPVQIPGVANGRYDLNISQDADTADRRKIVSFLDLFKTSIVPVVAQGNPTGLTATNMCGRTVAGGTGSYQTSVVQAISADCVKAGKKEITILDFPETANQVQTVLSGRGEALFLSPAVAAYIVKQSAGKLEVVNQTLPLIPGTKYSGWPLTRQPLGLAIALQRASQVLIKNGTWQKILTKWGASVGSVQPPLINGS